VNCNGCESNAQKLATVGEETSQSSVFVQLEANHAHIVTDKLDKFAVVGRSEKGSHAVKTLRLAAFAQTSSHSELGVRVYVVLDTVAAFQVRSFKIIRLYCIFQGPLKTLVVH